MPHNLDSLSDLSVLANGLQFDPLPSPRPLDPSLSHAPKLNHELTPEESVQAVVNALRYFPNRLHAQLAGEFARELETYGHIYMYRFRPDRWLLRARPISKYPAKCLEAAALMLMICNNLDESVGRSTELSFVNSSISCI
ncbi:unnamed protein product [Protopolystoma xenopodis]|uniref:Urocanase N-terminal domain-containing protein n=1 Tax=Protopolystoma xenopodis TaxID=117903 RepID=A0A448WDG8_9PLAT|nr:unnamed protein product [Protopolystoma xenopodis]